MGIVCFGIECLDALFSPYPLPPRESGHCQRTKSSVNSQYNLFSHLFAGA